MNIRVCSAVKFALILCFVTGPAFAQNTSNAKCEAIKPVRPVDTEVQNETKASANILFKSLGTADFENNYKKLEKNLIDKMPNADRVHIFSSSLYMLCELLFSSSVSDTEKFDRYEKLMDRWAAPPPPPPESKLGPKVVAQLSLMGFGDAVKGLKSSDLSSRSPEFFEPLLIAAVKDGNADLAQELISIGTNPNSTRMVQTPLMWSIQEGNYSMSKLLLEKWGANANVATPEIKSTALMWARDKPIPFAKLLLENGADPNLVNKAGWSALHLAAASGNLLVVQEMLKYGAKKDLKTADGQTARDIATTRGFHNIVELLN